MAEPPSALRYDSQCAVPHPLGVRPQGNMYLSESVLEHILFREKSMGKFVSISEDLFCGDVLSYCNHSDLAALSQVSHYARAFSFHHELWRDLVWNHVGRDLNREARISFKNSWRDTYIATVSRKECCKRARVAEDVVQVRRVFSDSLFESYRKSGLVPTPRWLGRENIDRVDLQSLMSRQEFVEQYEKKNKPVILKNFSDPEWSEMENIFSQVIMECGSVGLSMSEFNEYISETHCWRLDESPIFIFDTKNFSSKIYRPISLFPSGSDLFDLLEGEFRPDHKWLLVGAPGASSKWHVDPNSTNAWNAVIKGEKKWILLPPHLGPPPGVEVSGDGFAVRQPACLTDWLDGGFYKDLMRLHRDSVVEATCRAGEVMFIPRGWWHCVRNSGDCVTVAITQNYAAESSVHQVRRFLKEMSHCVSGVRQDVRSRLWKEFDRVLRLKRPDLLPLGTEDETETSGDKDGCVEKDVASDDNDSCCGGEVQEFSFWGHFSTGNRSLTFQR